MNYRREIDGLRALAVIPVILFHAGFQAFNGGFVGVDVFFVISGYLITTIIISELEDGKFSIINFYERRARRILPALLFVMFVCLPFAWLWLLPEDIKIFSQSLVAVSVFSSNIFFYNTSGYFDTLAELKPLLHTWSLAVEEQYYLFFPIFLMVTWRFGKRWILALLAVIFLVSLGLSQWLSVVKPMAGFFLLPARGWELLVGSFSAFYLSTYQTSHSNNWLNDAGSATGLALVILAIFAFNNQTPSPSLYTLVPTLGAALIILYGTSNTYVGKLLGAKLFVGIGLLSYSAYLWHQPLLAFAKNRFTYNLSETVTLTIVALTFMLSWFSWKYVESPFRNKLKFNRSQVYRLSFVGSLFFLGIGFCGIYTKAFEQSHAYIKVYDGDVGHDSFHKYVAENFFRCTPESIAKEALESGRYLRCMQSKNNSEVDIVLLGDSHAEHLFLGLAENLNNKNLAFYIKGSLPFLGNQEFDTIFNHILKKRSIHTVLISAHWIGRMNQIPNDTSLEKELLKTIGALVSAGKSVYIFDDIPKFPTPPERCKFFVEGFSEPICETNKADVKKYEMRYLPVLKSVSSQIKDVHFFEIGDLFCGDLICSMVKNGVLMYRDNNHLNILGSKFVGMEIVQHFPELNK
jgi:peptidoglycan/LPS O-acetylase OafA/YrhL